MIVACTDTIKGSLCLDLLIIYCSRNNVPNLSISGLSKHAVFNTKLVAVIPEHLIFSYI